MKVKPISILLVLFFISLSGTTFSQPDLAKQYHNPLGSLKALPMQLNLDFNEGADNEMALIGPSHAEFKVLSQQ